MKYIYVCEENCVLISKKNFQDKNIKTIKYNYVNILKIETIWLFFVMLVGSNYFSLHHSNSIIIKF